MALVMRVPAGDPVFGQLIVKPSLPDDLQTVVDPPSLCWQWQRGRREIPARCPMFYGLNAEDRARLSVILAELRQLYHQGYHIGDMLITFLRNMAFSHDAKLTEAIERHARDQPEASWLWRFHTLTWAARSALSLPGDFVE